MAVKDENNSLSEARDIYDALCRKLGDGDAAGASGENPIGSLNRAVLTAVRSTVQEPLLDIMGDVHTGTEASREMKTAVIDLPGPLQKELEELPSSLKIDELTTEFSSTARSVLETMKTVAADPKMLYPRLLCGSIPVDPAKVTNLAKNYNALDLQEPNKTDGNEAARAMRGPPRSTADVVLGFTGSFKAVAEPLLLGMEKLSTVREKLTSTMETVQSVSGRHSDLDELLAQQSKVGDLTERLTGLFAATEPGTPSSVASANVASCSLPIEDPRTNVLAVVEEGRELLNSADNFKGPLEQCVERVKCLGDALASLADDLKDLFEHAMDAFGTVVEHLRTFIANLPRILKEIRQFFVPTGLRALILQSSPETNNLLSDVEKLSAGVPDPEIMQSTARSVLDESESLSTVQRITKKIVDVVEIPMKLAAKLAVMYEKLPECVLAAAKNAMKEWADEFGERYLGAILGDGICDAVEAVAGEKLADAIGAMLPFGSSNFDAGNTDKKPGDRVGFGFMLSSLF